MNNLNNPPQWNIHPHGDDGDKSKWNYALLVPMLGLAAFRWIWSKECEKEVRKAKTEYTEKVTIAERELETKYRDIILENRRAVAHLEIEVEKEQNRTLSYRNVLISQSRKLVEERKQMEEERKQMTKQMEEERKQMRKQMVEERDKLKQEIKEAQRSSKASAMYASHLKKEEEWQTKAKSLLKEFEEALKDRQNMYCSFVIPKKKRFEIENKLLVKAASNPVAVEMGMTEGLIDIFKHDNHCAVLTNTNKRENGRLMWVYLKYWELTVDLKKFKKLEEARIEE